MALASADIAGAADRAPAHPVRPKRERSRLRDQADYRDGMGGHKTGVRAAGAESTCRFVGQVRRRAWWGVHGPLAILTVTAGGIEIRGRGPIPWPRVTRRWSEIDVVHGRARGGVDFYTRRGRFTFAPLRGLGITPDIARRDELLEAVRQCAPQIEIRT